MKKLLLIVSTLLLGLLLVSCKDDKVVIPEDVDTPIVISKVATNSFYAYSGIEIYNPSNEDVNLDNHFIYVYTASSNKIDTTIKLTGTVKAKDFFLVANKTSEADFLALSDQEFEGRMLTGDEALVLKGGKTTKDVLGQIGASYNYINSAMGGTLVRRPSRMEQRDVYRETDYLQFQEDRFDMFGKLEIPVSEEDLIYGPQLTDEVRALPFYEPNSNKGTGGGGAVVVTNPGYNDGDTTTFSYPGEGSKPTRYYFVDTPETQSTRIEEFGYQASNFTNNMLNEADQLGLNIEVQVPKGQTTDGGFQRFFGNVYVDGYSVSYMLLISGLAKTGVSGQGQDSESIYKGMSLESWMRYANSFAVENKLGIHGEKDESYYDNGKDEGENIGIRPYFEKPYLRSESVAGVSNETELKAALANNTITTIEVKNDIDLTDTIVIDGLTNKTIIGFGNTIKGINTKEAFNVKNSTVTFDNLRISNSLNPIIIENSTVNLYGLLDITGSKEGIIVKDQESTIKVGGQTGYKSDRYSAKFVFDLDLPFITVTGETNEIKPVILRGTKLVRTVADGKTFYKVV